MNANASDTALLHAWQRNRDAEAFYTLVNRHAQLVFRTCRNIVRNDTDAADVAQECFLSLATTPPEIERSLAGWLHRLATHRALNHVKQQQRRREREVRYASEFPEAVHKESDDLLSLIDETIDALPDDLRLPLVDHFFRHKSHQEVAEEYGIPRRTISHRINTGVEQLRAALNNRGVVAPVTGIAALLEWQRAEAASLPEGLYAKLCKYAIAGAPQKGRIHRQKVAYASAGMSGVFLVLLSLTATLVIAGWLLSYGRFLWHAAPPVAALENEELHAEVAAAPTATTENAKADDSTIERAAAAEPIAAMAGKVTGRVYDADTDAPIAGAQIKIAKDTDTYNPVATCTTDADGHYSSDELPPSAYMIYRGKTPGYGATSEKKDQAGSRMQKSQVDGIRFRMSRDTTIDLPVHKGLIVSGVVVDSQGNGIANATVSARARFQNNGQTTTTAGDGTFYLAGFSSTYDLCMSVSKQGYGHQNFSRLDIGFPGLQNLRVELPIASQVSGKVLQADGSPVAKAHVLAIHDTEVKRWPLDFPDAYTDAEGNYSINGLGPGAYAIQVFSGAYRHISIERDAAFVSVNSGDKLENVDVRMTARPGFTASGIVTEPDGTPVRNQIITLGATTLTDAEGRFSVSGLPGDQYRLETEGDNYRTGFEYVRVDPSIDEAIAMQRMGYITIDRDRKDLHFLLYPNTFTLSGHVLDAASGQPMKYFEICTFPEYGAVPHSTESWHEAQRIISEDGSFRLENLPLGPGPWSIVVRVPGYGIGTTDLSVTANMNEADVTIPVSEGLTVTGTVVDYSNKPVEGAEIIFGPPFESRVAVTTGDGSFRATGLPSEIKLNEKQLDIYRNRPIDTLTAFHPSYPPVRVPLPNGGDKSPMLFQFGPAGAIEVRVTRSGKPVTMAAVSINRPTVADTPCIGLGSKTLGSDGTASFRGVSPGPCFVLIQTNSGRRGPKMVERTVEVVAGKTMPVQVDIGGPLASLSGTFLIDGSPTGVSVAYTATTGEDPITVNTEVDPNDGTWKLDEVPAGSGTLTFRSALDFVTLERSMPVELKPGETAVVDINHGGVDDEAGESANLRGNIWIDEAWPQDTSVAVEMVEGETTLTYSRGFSIRKAFFTPEGEMDTYGPEPVADEPIEWSLDGVAAGNSTLTIQASDADGTDYARVIELNLSPDEKRNLDIHLTADDLAESNQ